MTRRLKRGDRGMVFRSLTGSLLCGMLLCTGCRMFQPKPKPGLLGPRALIPAPYVAPAKTGTAAARPAEPALPDSALLPVTPPGKVVLEENLVETAVLPPVQTNNKTPKASGGGIVLPPTVQSQRLSYTVKKGDSLWLIAELYGITVAELAAENGIEPDKILHPGDVLQLPPGACRRDPAELKRLREARKANATKAKKTTKKVKKSSAPKKSSPRKSTAREPLPANGIYTVTSGDNLWVISRRFGVSSADIMAWNHLKSDVLQIGQKLRLKGRVELYPVRKTTVESTTKPTVPNHATPPQNNTPPKKKPSDTQKTDKTPPADADTGQVNRPNLPVIGAGALDLPKTLAHVITEGETLKVIADMYGTSVEAILKANPKVKSDADLAAGAKLMVPYQ